MAFLKDDPALGMMFFCAKCRENHWVPPPLAALPTAAERYAEIERLWAGQDIDRESYNHWRHVVLALTCHEAIKEMVREHGRGQ
jgi:hypothetical protein